MIMILHFKYIIVGSHVDVKSLLKYTTIFTCMLTLLVILNIEFFSTQLALISEHIDVRINGQAMEVKTSSLLVTKKATNLSPKSIDQQFVYIEPVVEKKAVYLTFDDGPNEHTEKILSILKQEDALGTFFILYGQGKNNPNLLKKTNEEGHMLACHGVTHVVNKFYKDANSPTAEMKTCQNLIKDVTGVKTPFVRTPYGSHPHLTASQKKVLDDNGFLMWDWNVDSNDWQIRETEKLFQHTMRQVESLLALDKDPVILFHDTAVTAHTLERIIHRLKELNYEFKTLDEDLTPVQFRETY